MTLHERYDAAKATIDTLSRERTQLQGALQANWEQLIRADAAMALLEQLIAEGGPPSDVNVEQAQAS